MKEDTLCFYFIVAVAAFFIAFLSEFCIRMLMDTDWNAAILSGILLIICIGLGWVLPFWYWLKKDNYSDEHERL